MEWGGVLTFCPRRTSKYVTNLQLRCWLFYITCNYFVICYLSNCHYVVGSSNITCNYVVIFFFKLQLRCWLFEHHLQLRCYLLSFPQHEIIKKTPWNCHEKNQKKIEVCRNSRLMHFVSKRFFTNVNAAYAVSGRAGCLSSSSSIAFWAWDASCFAAAAFQHHSWHQIWACLIWFFCNMCETLWTKLPG